MLERLPIVHIHDPGLQGRCFSFRFSVILGTERLIQNQQGQAHTKIPAELLWYVSQYPQREVFGLLGKKILHLESYRH